MHFFSNNLTSAVSTVILEMAVFINSVNIVNLTLSSVIIILILIIIHITQGE